MADQGPEDDGQVGDASAAGGDGNGLARPHSLRQVEVRELAFDLLRDIVDPLGGERLADTEDPRQGKHRGSSINGGCG